MKRSKTLILTLALGALSSTSSASDHREAPLIQEDITADLADVYAFINPNDPSKLVVAMTVNPFSVPEEAITYNFSPNVRYRINIDTNGDAIPDDRVTVRFQGNGGAQTLTAELPGGVTVSGMVTAPTEEPFANPAIVNNGRDRTRVFAGPRDDPFFFDVVGFNRFLAGTGSFSGTDGFAGYNVSAIVVEFPLALLSSPSNILQVWAETSRRQLTLRRSEAGILEQSFGPWQAVDRVGAPGINTVLITPGLKDLYNIGHPVNDAADFSATIVASLTALGTDSVNIGILAGVAIPDTLKLDLTQPVGFPNGRGLADDVIDTVLFFVFNQVTTPDGVAANDVPFVSSFPFLAPPHQAQ